MEGHGSQTPRGPVPGTPRQAASAEAMTTQIVEVLDAVKELRIRLSEAEVKVRDSDIKITYMQTSRD